MDYKKDTECANKQSTKIIMITFILTFAVSNLGCLDALDAAGKLINYIILKEEWTITSAQINDKGWLEIQIEAWDRGKSVTKVSSYYLKDHSLTLWINDMEFVTDSRKIKNPKKSSDIPHLDNYDFWIPGEYDGRLIYFYDPASKSAREFEGQTPHKLTFKIHPTNMTLTHPIKIELKKEGKTVSEYTIT